MPKRASRKPVTSYFGRAVCAIATSGRVSEPTTTDKARLAQSSALAKRSAMFASDGNFGITSLTGDRYRNRRIEIVNRNTESSIQSVELLVAALQSGRIFKQLGRGGIVGTDQQIADHFGCRRAGGTACAHSARVGP